MITIKNKLLNVDILEELQAFEWNKGEVRGNKWLSCSPFRLEKNKSFAVNLESGLYIDSGLEDDYWRKGSLPKLLSFLYKSEIDEVETMLLEKYDYINKNVDELRLQFNLLLPKTSPKRVEQLSESLLEPFNYVNHYLINNRKLNRQILELFDVGFCPCSNLSVFPWRDKNGNLINVKFRKNNSKKFFYLPSGHEIKNHLYLGESLFHDKPKILYITESEIDSLYIRSLGEEFASVALGSANLSYKQEQLLRECPSERIVICTDRDKAGKRVANDISTRLAGYKRIERISLPGFAKDVNDLEKEELRNVLENAFPVSFSLLNN